MLEPALVTTVVAIVGLLLVAALAALGLKRRRLPYTVGLVIVGLLLGGLANVFPALGVLRDIELSPDVILFVFLPTLIFESAFNLNSRLLSQNLAPVLALAAPGLLLSTMLVGFLVSWTTPLELGPALLFGALISATDPIAVVALFKELGAPKRLAILVESESLFNDATAIVLFQIVLAVLAGGILSVATVGEGIAEFAFVFGGGLAVGGTVGYLMVRSIALADVAPIGWAIVAVMVARTVTVFGLTSRLPGAEPIDTRHQTVLWWGGLRGAVALALALSLPTAFASRELIIAMAVGVVLFTLLSGGLTMGPLIRWLGLDKPTLVSNAWPGHRRPWRRSGRDSRGFCRRRPPGISRVASFETSSALPRRGSRPLRTVWQHFGANATPTRCSPCSGRRPSQRSGTHTEIYSTGGGSPSPCYASWSSRSSWNATR